MEEIVHKLWKKEIGYKVDSVAISNDGEFVLAGSSQDTNLYFLSQGQLRWRYKTKASIRCLTISQDGRYILAGAEDSTLYLLDKNSHLIWEEYVSTNTIVISADLKYIACGGNDCNIYFFTRYGKLLWRWTTMDYVNSIAIASQDNAIIATADDRNLYFLTKEGTLIWRTRLKACGVKVAISEDGDEIVVACNNQYVYCYDRKCRLKWEYHFPNEISGLSITSDGQCIIVASPWQNLHLLNRSGKLSYLHETNFGIISLFFTPKGYLAAGSSDKNVYVFKYQVETIREPESSIEYLIKDLVKNQQQILQQYPKEIAVMTTDIQNYTPFIEEENEIRKRKLQDYENILSALIKDGGLLIKKVCEAYLIIFTDPIKAVECGRKIQAEFVKYNQNKSPDEEICVRIGITYGKLKIEKENQLVKPFLIACRMLPYSDKGQVLITKDIVLLIEEKMLVEIESMGLKEIKGLEKLIPIYEVKESPYANIGWYDAR
ncbi:MAG: PQQ-binding-like beta-propeller repeat protein [bacterium]